MQWMWVGVGVFSGALFIVGQLGDRKLKAEQKELWSKLAPRINGTARADGVAGTYQGRAVKASIAGDDMFLIELTIRRGLPSWSLERRGEGFELDTKDEDVRAAGLVERFAAFLKQHAGQYQCLYYDSKSGKLTYQNTRGTQRIGLIPAEALTQDVFTPTQNAMSRYPVPHPQDFKKQLAFLESLATMVEGLKASR
jgi:hypothetical protein